MEIISGIHQIDGVQGANCYLVTSGPEMFVIDTGMPRNGNLIINYVKRIGENPSDLKFIILTHSDIDHVGSVAELKKITSAKIAIHENDAAILSGKAKFKSVRGPLGLLFKLASPLMGFHPVVPDIILKDNMDIAGYKVIFTPGHTNGSICLYQPGKTIFVGDALKSDADGNPWPPSKTMSIDVNEAKRSVIAISKLEFDILLPGHGAPVKGGASAKLKGMLAKLQWDEEIPATKK